jgi:methylase of polypeptide subunit release factors
MRSRLRPDPRAAEQLGKALRRVRYSETSISDLLDDEAYSGDPEDLPMHLRRLPDSKLATVIRAFFLGVPVPTADAERALGRAAVEAAGATGLAEVGKELVPGARILPVDELLIAADGYSRGTHDPEDYVAAYSPTSHVCASLTPRHRVARALDVGTGSGAQAVLAAAHADHVVATDVNPRALEYTLLNAALNGMSNLEVRRGSFFEPVDGETFDLITCNAPYVVSPERRWTYRDAGREGDEVSELVVKDAADHLAEGGYATLLVSWLGHDEESADERVLEWAEGTDCDSWILVGWESDALDHAAGWNSHLAGDSKAYSQAIDDWTRYLERLGAGWVSEGAVLLHRRPGRTYTVRADSFDEDTLEEASDQIRRAFAARAWLAELDGRASLLDARLGLAAPMRLERELEPRRGATEVVDATVALAEGTNSVVETTPNVLEVIASLDTRKPLRAAIDDVARRLDLSESEVARLRRDALETTEELLELGALRFHES